MLEKIKLGLIAGSFALGLTACGGGGDDIVAKAKEGFKACESQKDMGKKSECLGKAYTDSTTALAAAGLSTEEVVKVSKELSAAYDAATKPKAK